MALTLYKVLYGIISCTLVGPSRMASTFGFILMLSIAPLSTINSKVTVTFSLPNSSDTMFKSITGMGRVVPIGNYNLVINLS